MAGPAVSPQSRSLTTLGGIVVVSHLRGWGLPWLLTLTLGALVLTPLIMLFSAGLQSGTGAWTFAAYQKVFSAAATYQVIGTTVWLAIVRVTIGACIGILLAWTGKGAAHRVRALRYPVSISSKGGKWNATY